MTRSIALSLVFHSVMIILTVISLPFMTRTPVDLPPILSVDLIKIKDKLLISSQLSHALTKVRNVLDEDE